MIAPLELRQLPRFPCQTENKKPLTPHGFKDAVRVRDDSGWPLVGVPTGVKFDALDIDPRNGGASWFDANFDALPLTRCHQTQSGGIHLLFLPAVGLRCTSGRIAPGVDVRAKGGYVIWWPREGLPFEDHPLCGWPDWSSKWLTNQRRKVTWLKLDEPAQVTLNASPNVFGLRTKCKAQRPTSFRALRIIL
jgi:hypothetical protein